ncbi:MULTISPECIES: hypothetical protein [unclassified Polaribacter]|uniref:hypothetical protein n=1 Tax=unclassified Polaribacter TaxID=196858 RepID=UPI0011BED793|nr:MULTISPECIES: hypothetical protein [unclassified Polaribacter]TXD53558.1 hypothetical protein ES043_04005 [Polaribacter sp. IC063]TXD58630.1 hypothetical protein ES044_11970 [Polaribacter sp. IC066]
MKNYIYKLLLLILIVGCSKEDEITLEPINSDLTDQQILLKETSKLLGKTLTDVNALNHLKEILKAKDLDEDQQIISFGLLFGDNKGLRKKESSLQKKYKQKSITYNFKEAFTKTYEKNKEEFSTIGNLIKSKTSAKTNSASSSSKSLVNLLEDENLQIYFPYDPEFEDDDKSINEFGVTFNPLELVDTNISWNYTVDNEEVSYTSVIDNDYLDDNPVFVVGKIEPCDLNDQIGVPAKLCSYVELKESNFVPDPLPVGPVLLTYSVNHNEIPETDIISTNIPRIKVNGTSYMGFGGTRQKLKFFRATSDGSDIKQNSDGSITAGTFDYELGYISIKRKFLKRKLRWLNLNFQLDPDWNMSENTQSMAVFSIHHFSTDASYELKGKSGFKIDPIKGIVPSAEISGEGKVKISVGNAKFRANVELSRRQVLSTITGPGITGRQELFDGINYNIKKIGVIDYYLEHYYTDLTD